MAAQDQPIQIISNESNHVIEVESGGPTHSSAPETTADKVKAAEQLEANHNLTDRQTNNEVATNDGGLIETLDTDFHGKPGVAEGESISGSNRADYYEARSQGKTDAEEELDALNKDA